jgi:PAS domain S-box-containing protein
MGGKGMAGVSEPAVIAGSSSVTQDKARQNRVEANPDLQGPVGNPGPFAAAARATHIPMLITDPRKTGHPVVFVNGAFCRLTGYTPEEVLGRNFLFLHGPETDPATVVRVRAAVAAAEPIETDIRNYRKNGEPFWSRLSIAPVHDAGGYATYFIANLVDVTAEHDRLASLHSHDAALALLAEHLSDRTSELAALQDRLQAEVEERERVEAAFRRALAAANEAQTALMEREMHLRSVLDTVPDAMIVIDSQARMQSFSATAERLFGYSRQEAVGRNVSMLMPSPYRDQHDVYLARYFQTGEKRVIGRGRVMVGQRKDGSTFPMELSVGEMVSGDNHFFTGFVRDLTEREDTRQRLLGLQAELIHISRFTAMGEMASTLAHELNQPLTAVVSYLNGSRLLLTGSDNLQTLMIRDAVERAAEQALRAGQIIRRLRQFVARGEIERQVENLAKLIEEAGELALIGTKESGVQVDFKLDPRMTFVLVDKVQIHQVLVNLIRNAIEAMQETTQRVLTISTTRRDGTTAEISVGDTGPGIAPAIAAQLFQPFVTTKPEGMGVGLSISRTIVESHGGHLWAEPNPDGGTIFRLTLRVTSTEEPIDSRTR